MLVFGKRLTRLRMIFVLLAVIPWVAIFGALIAVVGTVFGMMWWSLEAP